MRCGRATRLAAAVVKLSGCGGGGGSQALSCSLSAAQRVTFSGVQLGPHPAKQVVTARAAGGTVYFARTSRRTGSDVRARAIRVRRAGPVPR